MKPIEVFFIAADYTGARLDQALFDGPGWYFWGGAVPEGDGAGPYDTREEAEQAAAKAKS